MTIEDIEGPNGVKEVVQPGHEEYARDIGRVLTVLQEIKERTESHSEQIRRFYRKFKNVFESIDNVLLYMVKLRSKDGDEAFCFQCKLDESANVGHRLELIEHSCSALAVEFFLQCLTQLK